MKTAENGKNRVIEVFMKKVFTAICEHLKTTTDTLGEPLQSYWIKQTQELVEGMTTTPDQVDKMPYKWELFSILNTPGKDDFWFKIGNGFRNRDNSLSILLNAIPMTRKVILRVKKDQEPEQTEQTSSTWTEGE